jgi:hypothetical protein
VTGLPGGLQEQIGELAAGVWDERTYPPKAILGTAYEFATGQRLASGDFEGGKTGAVRVLGELGFTILARRPAR